MSLAPMALEWLVRRPIAHRGLHDRGRGVVENSLAAARAAMTRGFAIECDVQRTADGEAVVFHDATLDRLTAQSGPLVERNTSDLGRIPLAGCDETIPTLSDFLALIGGHVPLVCEVKSDFDGDMRLTDRVLAVAASYQGPLAIKSFDPGIIAHLRRRGISRPLGIVAEAAYEDPEWSLLSAEMKRNLAEMLHYAETRPDFLSYHVQDLPHAVPYLCRTAMALPVMTWTVRTPDQRQRAATWADQMVFEGFVP